MIEFGDFFYKDKPLSSKLHPSVKTNLSPVWEGISSLLQLLLRVKKKPSAMQSKRKVSISEQVAAEVLNKLKAKLVE